MDSIRVGVERASESASPSWPRSFRPQHQAAEAVAAQLEPQPALSAAKLCPPETATGSERRAGAAPPAKSDHPQHSTSPVSATPHVASAPGSMADHDRPPTTSTGVVRFSSVPSPRDPLPFSPQHHADPSAIAHVVCSPAATRLTGGSPPTAVGADASTVDPSPMAPDGLSPQQ